jgi:hypothetical protein
MLAEGRGRGEGDRCRGSIDREIPAVAGDVPVKLVIALEPPEHPGRVVADPIFMLADGDDFVGAADTDSDAIHQRLDLVRLFLAIEPGSGEIEAYPYPAAARGLVAGREVAEDAVVDDDIFNPDADCLRDVERTVFLDRYPAVERQDALFGRRGLGKEQGEERDERSEDRTHRAQAGRAKSTLGAVWMLASASS